MEPNWSTDAVAAADRAVDRRSLMTRAIWGTAGVATAATAGTVALASPVAAHGKGKRRPRTATYDVACLLNTFAPIVAEGATDPDTDFRGTTFYVEGELYRGGTIPDGVDDFDPASARAIGHWMCRGWFINRTGRPGETDRPEPHVITHQEYLLSRIRDGKLFPRDQLSSSGLEGGPGVAIRSVIGGAGRWHGAHGSVHQHTIGANLTDGPNFRFRFFFA